MWFDISVNQNLWPEEPPSALSGLKGGVSCWDRVSGSAYRNKVREALHRKKSMSVILIDNKLAISCTDVMIQWCNDMQWCKCMIRVLMLFNYYWLLIIWWQSEACNQTLSIFDSQGLRSGVVLGRPGTTPWDSRNSPKGCFFRVRTLFLTINSFYRPKVDSCRFIKHELLWSIVIYVNLCYIRKSWHLLTCFWFFANLANLASGIAFKKPITAHTHTHQT